MRTRSRWWLLAALPLLAWAGLRPTRQVAPPTPGDWSGRCVGVTDGDTLKVLHDGREEKLRLWGIDAPELHQAFGVQSKKLASSLAFGETLTVRVHDTDRYGRTVAEVVRGDGRNVNQAMVAGGLAWWYQRYAPEERVLEQLEREARAARRGLWADPSPEAPWEFRQRQRARSHTDGRRSSR